MEALSMVAKCVLTINASHRSSKQGHFSKEIFKYRRIMHHENAKLIPVSNFGAASFAFLFLQSNLTL
jgi:hypothetical protein